MGTKQLIGILLVAGIVVLYVLWLRFQRKQERATTHGNVQEATILIKGAYDPHVIAVKSGIPVRIYFNRQEDAECSRFVTFDPLKIRKDLKPFTTTAVEFTPQQAGEIRFACDMGMYQGKIIVE